MRKEIGERKGEGREEERDRERIGQEGRRDEEGERREGGRGERCLTTYVRHGHDTQYSIGISHRL